MNKFTLSTGHNPNYLAWVHRVGEVYPIPDADRLVKTTINGYDIVVSKDTKPGDIVVYFPTETMLSNKFLSANNLYELSERHLNSNYEEVEKLITKSQECSASEAIVVMSEAKSKCGFFNKHGRVRMLKLRGEYSMGFLTPTSSLINAYPELVDIDWEALIGTSFDTVCDDLICQKYIPAVKVNEHVNTGQRNFKKTMKKLKRFDRIVPGTFEFHYDTKQLGEHFKEIKPDDVVTISVKVHGTSTIMSNIPVNRKLTVWEKIKKFLGCNVVLTEYGNVYSSRRVIKNQYINPTAGPGFYTTDVWGKVNDVFAPLLTKDMTLYGEIVGYEPGSTKMIQPKHDYGCKPGEWKFMPYRITTINEDGVKQEWNLTAVDNCIKSMIALHPELEDKVLPLNILYHGPMKDLYPHIPVDDNWHYNVLEAMKNDNENFLMEADEPMCINRVPREGVVIRIDDDIFARAWKLKTKRHYDLEAKAHDKGEVDIEELASTEIDN